MLLAAFLGHSWAVRPACASSLKAADLARLLRRLGASFAKSCGALREQRGHEIHAISIHLSWFCLLLLGFEPVFRRFKADFRQISRSCWLSAALRCLRQASLPWRYLFRWSSHRWMRLEGNAANAESNGVLPSCFHSGTASLPPVFVDFLLYLVEET